MKRSMVTSLPANWAARAALSVIIDLHGEPVYLPDRVMQNRSA
jgi:hypothetical protein